MKQITILVILILAMNGCASKCVYEGDKVHKVAAPIVQGIAEYSKDHGRPKSLVELKEVPFVIKSCANKSTSFRCEKIDENKYFFVVEDERYILDLWDWEASHAKGFGLEVIYHDTRCEYYIYENGHLMKNYLDPHCGLIGGHCKAWGKQ